VASSVKDRFVAVAGTALIGHASDSGNTWSTSATGGAATSAATINGAGLIYNNNGSGASVIKSNWSPAGADYEIYFDITKVSNVSTCGVFGRYTASNTGYVFYYNSVNFFIATMTTTGGVTNLAQVAQTINVGATLRWRARMVGTGLFIDTQNPATGVWTQVLTTTDSTFASVGPCGVYFFGSESSSTGDQLGNFVALDGAATDMLVTPSAVGGAGNATMSLRGYHTAWTPGTPGTPTITIAHSGDAATIVSQSVAAVNVASVVVNTGTSAGTFTLSDGTESSTSTVAASTSVVVNPVTDVQSATPHINANGLWTLSTVSASRALVPFQTPDYHSEVQDYAFEFTCLANQSTLLCNLPNGTNTYVSVDGAAASTIVGDGTNKTITLHSIADGLNHLIRLTPAAGSKISDLTLYGAAPALTSVAKTHAYFADYITTCQCPSVASPVSYRGAYYLDTPAKGGTYSLRSVVKGSSTGYDGGAWELQTNGTDLDVLALTNSANSQLEPAINGVLPTLATLVAQGDAVLGTARHWIPVMVGGSSNPNTLRVVNLGLTTAETQHFCVRAWTNGTKFNAFCAAGNTSFTVVSTTGFAAGDWIQIGTMATGECVQIGAVTDDTHFSLLGGLSAAGLAQNHSVGARVVGYALAAASITPWSAQVYTKTMFVVGDSIVAGAQRNVAYSLNQYDPTNGGFYRYALANGWDVILCGVPGNHSSDACLRIFGGTVNAGLKYNGDGDITTGDLAQYARRPLDLFVVYVGTNDVNTATLTGPNFQSNIQALISAGMDNRYVKNYASGGRILIVTTFSPLDWNTDPGVNGVLGPGGLHSGGADYGVDATSINYWLQKAVAASGVNVGRPGYCQVSDLSAGMVTGTKLALGADMHDAFHPSESGHTQMAANLGLVFNTLFNRIPRLDLVERSDAGERTPDPAERTLDPAERPVGA
jgi:GDSL-like Lipase/Acylhydrolase family